MAETFAISVWCHALRQVMYQCSMCLLCAYVISTANILTINPVHNGIQKTCWHPAVCKESRIEEFGLFLEFFVRIFEDPKNLFFCWYSIVSPVSPKPSSQTKNSDSTRLLGQHKRDTFLKRGKMFIFKSGKNSLASSKGNFWALLLALRALLGGFGTR